MKAQQEVRRIELLIEQNDRQIAQTRKDMRKADPRMYEGFDKFLKHLYEKGEQLELQRQEALRVLYEEQERLKEREKEVNVLEKHKENKREEYKKEQDAIELKTLNEVGSQKHFARSSAAREEEAEEELKELLAKYGETT